MKTTAVHLRTISLLFTILILLQGCTVYKGNVTLDQAVTWEKKVKVMSSDNEEPYHFEHIKLRDGKYVGIPKRYSQSSEVILNPLNITEIKEHDKTLSTLISFSPLFIIAGLGIILFGSE